MASFELTGTVKLIMETQTFPSGFSKREFVVTTPDDRYPQDIAFGCLKEKAALLDSISVGQTVKVSFDIAGREYNDRYFVNLNAWRIESADAGAPADEMPPIEDMGEPLPDADENMPF
jgi:hypothetical protein